MMRPMFALLLLLGSAPAYAADPPAKASGSAAPNTAARPSMPAPATDIFLSKVAAGNTFEIESSKLALGKRPSQRVVAFANQMVTDHESAATKFKKAVTDAKLKAPPEAMDAKHKSIVDSLAKQEAAQFEKAYIDAQYNAHVETVELFQSYADGGENARMKQFARNLLPTLRTHLDHVSKMRSL